MEGHTTAADTRTGVSPVLVVAALAPMLRGQPGRNLGDNDGTTRHLSGRRVRGLAFRLRQAFLLRPAYGGQDGGQVGLAFLP